MSRRSRWIARGAAKIASLSRVRKGIFRRCPVLVGVVSSLISSLEDQSADGSGVGEDSDAEDDDDGGCHRGTHAQLVAHEDEEAGDDDVPEEGGDENSVVEGAFEPRLFARG